jgi:hypothetical protein
VWTSLSLERSVFVETSAHPAPLMPPCFSAQRTAGRGAGRFRPQALNDRP